jgi:hypothetical protein
MISLHELKNASRREKLAIGVSAFFFVYLIGVATYVGTTLVSMALIGGIVGLVTVYLRAGTICPNVGPGVNSMIKLMRLKRRSIQSHGCPCCKVLA